MVESDGSYVNLLEKCDFMMSLKKVYSKKVYSNSTDISQKINGISENVLQNMMFNS